MIKTNGIEERNVYMKILIKGATVVPVTTPSFVGDVLLVNGKIDQINHTIQPVHDAKIVDGAGRFLYPGIIDVHTHLGLYDEGTGWAGNDANETIEAMTPHIRSLDGIYPLDSGFTDAIRAGVTCAHVMPGSANVIGGTTCVIKTHGKNVEKMLVKKYAGLKLALGENPKKMHSHGAESITRMGIMGMLRETFLKAKYDLTEVEKKLPRYKPIIHALNGDIPVRIHAHRADDILSAIRFAEEFELDLRIEHCTEGHLIAEELEEKNLKVSIGPTMTRRSKIELRNKSWNVYSALAEKGVEISITTDHPYVPIQYLNVTASLAIREGLDEKTALEGITINPAKNLGVDDRVGSIEVGKDADVVLWNYPVFDYRAKPIMTIIDGTIVYEQK